MQENEFCPTPRLDSLRSMPWFVKEPMEWNALWDLACTFMVADSCEIITRRDCDD